MKRYFFNLKAETTKKKAVGQSPTAWIIIYESKFRLHRASPQVIAGSKFCSNRMVP